MDAKTLIMTGALLAGLGVLAGAFGAHGLESRLRPDPAASADVRDVAARRLQNFEVAVRYQMYHALALCLTGFLAIYVRSPWLTTAACSFLAGMILFCGLLYAWVFTGERTLVLLVPVGGVAFIVGWLALAVAATRLVSTRTAG